MASRNRNPDYFRRVIPEVEVRKSRRYWEAPAESAQDGAVVRRPRGNPERAHSEPVVAPVVRIERRMDPPAHRNPPAFETTYTSSNNKDVTVHLEADVFLDIDDELEFLNRMMRLGDFKGAKVFFNAHLKQYSNHPAVFVNYAEVLLEMDDFKAVLALDDSSVDFQSSSDGSGGALDWQTLENEWKFIQAIALYVSQSRKDVIMQLVTHLLDDIIPVTENLSSTGVRILYLAMQLDADAWLPGTSDELSDWAGWKTLFKQLLGQGRIWDFHDLFIAAVSVFRPGQWIPCFLGLANETQALDTMVRNWNTTTEPDESTQLALLDILSVITVQCIRTSSELPIAKRSIELAEPIGATLIKHFPANVRSRPFLLFSFAKASLLGQKEGRTSSMEDHFEYWPGIGRSWPAAITWCLHSLPYYIPVRHENPGLPRLEGSSKNIEAIKMILASATEMQDYRLQLACLGYMILHSSEPWPLFEKLARLQDQTANRAGQLCTSLSKYLVCRDDRDKAQLFGDLTELTSWDDPGDVVLANRHAARDIIRRALSKENSSDPSENIGAAVKYEPYVSPDLQDFLREHCPEKFVGKRSLPFRSSKGSAPITERFRERLHYSSADSSNHDYSEDESADVRVQTVIRERSRERRTPGMPEPIVVRSYPTRPSPPANRRRSPSPVRVQDADDDSSIDVRVRRVTTLDTFPNGRINRVTDTAQDETVKDHNMHVVLRERSPGYSTRINRSRRGNVSPRSINAAEEDIERYTYKLERREDDKSGLSVNVEITQTGSSRYPEMTNELGKVVPEAVGSLLSKYENKSERESTEARRRGRERTRSPVDYPYLTRTPKSEERVSSWLRDNETSKNNIPPDTTTDNLKDNEIDPPPVDTKDEVNPEPTPPKEANKPS